MIQILMTGMYAVIIVKEIHAHQLKFVTHMSHVNLTTLDLIFVAIIAPITGPLALRVIMSVIGNTGGFVMEAVLLVIKDLILLT